MGLSESVVNLLFPRKSYQSVTESALTETPGTQRPWSAVNNISGLLSADQTVNEVIQERSELSDSHSGDTSRNRGDAEWDPSVLGSFLLP